MEAADDDRQVGGTEPSGKVHGAGKLIGLYPDQPDKSPAGLPDPADDTVDIDDGVGFVVSFQSDLDFGAERVCSRTIGECAIDDSEAVRGDSRAKPLNDIAVIVVMRRLDQDDQESASRSFGAGRLAQRQSRLLYEWDCPLENSSDPECYPCVQNKTVTHVVGNCIGTQLVKRARRDSNPRPPDSKSGALSS